MLLNKNTIIFYLLLNVMLFPIISFGNSININEINTHIKNNSNNTICDLLQYNDKLTKEYITEDYIKSNGMETFKSFYFKINDMISYNNNYKYGVVIKKSNLRFMSTDEPYYKSKNNNFDYLQNSEIKFNEPIIILFEYKDWYFVQSYNTNGWINKHDVALFKTKKLFQDYVNYNKFVVVIDKNLIIDNLYLDMSVKLNYLSEYKNSYKIKLPRRDYNGFVYFVDETISKTSLNNGYLLYNENNLKKQAFKYLDTQYGWGGMNNGIDCSGFILNVYGSFGIKLPRDSINQQKSTGKFIELSENMTISERLSLLKGTKIGSLLYFKGHIMMYLGFIDNKPKIIHSVALYLDDCPMSVIVSDLDIKRMNNITFIESITSITNFL